MASHAVLMAIGLVLLELLWRHDLLEISLVVLSHVSVLLIEVEQLGSLLLVEIVALHRHLFSQHLHCSHFFSQHLPCSLLSCANAAELIKRAVIIVIKTFFIVLLLFYLLNFCYFVSVATAPLTSRKKDGLIPFRKNHIS